MEPSSGWGAGSNVEDKPDGKGGKSCKDATSGGARREEVGIGRLGFPGGFFCRGRGLLGEGPGLLSMSPQVSNASPRPVAGGETITCPRLTARLQGCQYREVAVTGYCREPQTRQIHKMRSTKGGQGGGRDPSGPGRNAKDGGTYQTEPQDTPCRSKTISSRDCWGSLLGPGSTQSGPGFGSTSPARRRSMEDKCGSRGRGGRGEQSPKALGGDSPTGGSKRDYCKGLRG